MLRWTVLLVAFAVWAACLAVLCVNYRPKQEENVAPANQAALDDLFAENTDDKKDWLIFVDFRALLDGRTLPMASSGEAQPPALAWNGTDESQLAEVGWLEVTIKRKHEMRLSQNAEMRIAFPSQVDSPLLKALGDITYKSWAEISLDNGLETCSSSLSLGLGLEVQSLGVREGDVLSVTQNISQKDKQLLSQRVAIPIGLKSAPNAELLPFQNNRGVKTGAEWDLTMLDTKVDLSGGARPKVVVLKARCTGRRQITLDGNPVTAFEVGTGDGNARAWYSADGVVLKQAYKLAGLVEVVAVRDDPLKPKRLRDRIKRNAAKPPNGFETTDEHR